MDPKIDMCVYIYSFILEFDLLASIYVLVVLSISCNYGYIDV